MTSIQSRIPTWAVVTVAAAFLAADSVFGALERTITNWSRAGAEQTLVELERTYRVEHPYYSHSLAANYEGYTVWGPFRYALNTNSLGFRDVRRRDVSQKTPGFRLLLIGDSYLEGMGVDFESSVAGILASRYANDGVEVLNGAVASYSPAIYWKKTEHLLERDHLEVDAVVVFLDLSDIQDEAWWYRIDSSGRVRDFEERDASGILGAWRRTSLTYRVAVKALEMLYPHAPRVECSIGEAHKPSCRVGWTQSRVLMDTYGRDGLRRADVHLTQLAALLRDRRVPLTVVVYPWPQQLLWNDRTSIQVDYWKRWAQREQVHLVEIFSPFFAEVDSRGLSETIDRYFIAGDTHWTTVGNTFVAAQFAAQYGNPKFSGVQSQRQ